MNRFLSKSFSENPKPVLSHAEGSAIQNPKWLRLSIIAFVLVVAGAVASAQQPKKVSRIGYLSSFDAATESARSEEIRRALRELGWIEGQNIAIEYRYAEGKRDRQPELAAELVRLKVEAIVVTGGEPLIRTAKNATRTIPIVMTAPAPILLTQALLRALPVLAATSPALLSFRQS